MCVLSILSTQRAETASCSVLRRMRRKNWRPRSRAHGLSLNARYENLEIVFTFIWTNVHSETMHFIELPDVNVRFHVRMLQMVIWIKMKMPLSYFIKFTLVKTTEYVKHYIITALADVLWLFVVLMCVSCFQPDAPRSAHFVSTKNNEPQLLEPIPYEFMA